LAVQIFAKETKGISILLHIDNSTAVAYAQQQLPTSTGGGDSITSAVSAYKGPMVVVHGEASSQEVINFYCPLWPV